MAWIEQHKRANGGVTARVFWRPSGCRDVTRVWETFGRRIGCAESRACGRVEADGRGRWSAVARWLGEGRGVRPAAGCRRPHDAST
jgi:hypothetical protein